MRNLLALTALLACTALTPAFADGAQPEPSADSRIKLLRYDSADVYTITTRYGYQTNVVFGTGEDIQTISVGDRSMWQIIPAGSRLFIRPMEENAATNMTVITSKHAYQFDLKSLAEGKSGGNIYSAKFTYPEDEKPKPQLSAAMPPTFATAPLPPTVTTTQTVTQTVTTPSYHASNIYSPPPAPVTPPAPLADTEPFVPNYNYTYSGPDNMAPLQVYDNGKTTFIRYHDDQPLPAVYVIDSAGKEIPASYYVQKDVMVVDQVAGEMLLKGNSGSLHIYNETLNPR